jgi:hypothetical protein
MRRVEITNGTLGFSLLALDVELATIFWVNRAWGIKLRPNFYLVNTLSTLVRSGASFGDQGGHAVTMMHCES